MHRSNSRGTIIHTKPKLRYKLKRKKHSGIVILSLILLLILAAAFIVHDSRTNLEISEYNISSDKLPDSFKGFKIVQLSDLHGEEFDGRLTEKVRALTPDIIVLTGDFISDAGDLQAVDSLTSELKNICPVYFVSGNHDFASGEISALSEILERNNVRYLHNEYLCLEIGGDKIILGGVEDPNSWAEMLRPEELADAMAAEYPDAFRILLGHRNYWVTEYPDLPVDLIFCGHAHGGIVRLPGVGGLLGTNRALFPDYVDGMFQCGSYCMVVSRGLGSSIAVPRFLNRPEIVCVTLN